MKLKTKILCVIAAASVLLAGCASNPTFDKSQPVSEANPAYVPDTNFLAKAATIGATAKNVNDSIPGNPYKELIDGAIAAILGGISVGGAVGVKLGNVIKAHKKATQTVVNTLNSIPGGAQAAQSNAPDAATASIIAAHVQDAPLNVTTMPKAGT